MCCASARPRPANPWAARSWPQGLRARLGIDFGGTTPDGRLTLEAVYCLGNCALSPAGMLDGRLYGRLDERRLEGLLASTERLSMTVAASMCRAIPPPSPWAPMRSWQPSSARPRGAGLPSIWSATAAADCSGWSRWSRSRRRRAVSPMGRSPRRMSRACSKPGFSKAAPHRPAPRADRGDPLSQAPGAPDLRALRDHRSALARRTIEAHGGFAGLKQALTLEPAAIVEQVTRSGLRGRGGAGFPAGIKWKTVLGAPRRAAEIHRLQCR